MKQSKNYFFIFILCLSLSSLVTDSLSSQDKKATINKMSLWMNKNGTQLRGMNLHQRRTYEEWDADSNGQGSVGPPFTQAEIDALATLGANWVDISHPGLFSEKLPYTLDKDVQKNLDGILEMVRKAGMFATITFRTGPERSEFSFIGGEEDAFVKSHLNNDVWKNEPAQRAWAAMWRYAAHRYKDNPIVVGYKLMCEPNAEATLFDMYDPEEFYSKYKDALYDWNRFYPKIISAIRGVDAETPILLSPAGWASVRWLPYLRTSHAQNIVYTVHQYEPQEYYTHQGINEKNTYPGTIDTDEAGNRILFNKDWLDDLLAITDKYAKENKVNMAVGESGVHRWVPHADLFINDQLSLFENRGYNYVMWDWNSTYRITHCPDNDSFSLLHGPDPNNHTKVKNKLLDVVLAYWKKNRLRP